MDVEMELARKQIRDFFERIGMGELDCTDSGRILVGENLLADVLQRIGDDISPNDAFWRTFASWVRIGYADGICREVHQFRYVIDAHQVRYIRTHFVGDTDEEKLAAYVATLDEADWTYKESARLHQKTWNGCFEEASAFPNGIKGANYKIVCNSAFHSEFIIDVQGNFLYILDENPVTRKNGIINGASFNYARKNDYAKTNRENSEHYRLDMAIGKLDPDFRVELLGTALARFVAPKDTAEYKKSGLREESRSRARHFYERVLHKK